MTGCRRPTRWLLLCLLLVGCAPAGGAHGSGGQAAEAGLSYHYRVYLWRGDGTTDPISPNGGFFTHASIHPAGTDAVFWGGMAGLPRIWRNDFSGGSPRPLTPGNMAAMTPSFDWRGERVVFVSDFAASERGLELGQIAEAWRTRTYRYPGYFNIWVMDAEGRNLRQVTRGDYQDRRPAFSPDGETIVFLSNRGKSPLGLYTVPADGSAEPRLLLRDGWSGRPWYSVDGEWIFFTTDVRRTGNGWESVLPVPGTSYSREGVHRRICRIPSGGGRWEPVTPEGMPRSHGVFADPDGRHIWFHSTKDGITRLYRFALDSGELEVMQPPGFEIAAHVTRAANGNLTFDVPGGKH